MPDTDQGVKVMARIIIREFPKTAKIEILGHTFNGLSEIKQAVEFYSRTGRNNRWKTDPRKPVDGVHVIQVYEPYPCFDSDDYACEDRDFCNFFFSKKPFSESDAIRLDQLPHHCNAQMVHENMPEWAVPAVYYGGDCDTIIVATCE